MKTIRVGLIIGHSLTSQGAINEDSSLTEFEYNKSIVASVAERLAEKGLTPIVIYRTAYNRLPHDVNDSAVDIAISFHCNAFNKKASGTEVLFLKGSERGAHLASCIQEKLVSTLGLANRGTKAIRSHDRGGRLLCKTTMPCIIAEPFFIDNDRDLSVASLLRNELIDTYVTGICNAVQW